MAAALHNPGRMALPPANPGRHRPLKGLGGTLTLLLGGLLLASCSLPLPSELPLRSPAAGVQLYLQPLPQEAQRLNLLIAVLAARSAEGVDRPLLAESLKLRGADLADGQTPLLGADLPPGPYVGLVLRMEGAVLLTAEGAVDLLVPPEPILLPAPFQVEAQGHLALFLSLAGERLVTDGYRLSPQWSLATSHDLLPGLKGLVANGRSGRVTVFNKKSAEVVTLLTLGRAPVALVLDRQRQRAFVALAGENTVAALELASDRLLGKIRLRLGDAPERLALAPDGRTLVVCNAKSNSLSIVDAASLTERERVLLPASPADVFFGASSEVAYVLLPTTNTLTLVELGRGQVRATVHLEEAPYRGVVSADGRTLYLLAADSPHLLLVDAASLLLKDRLFVGAGATTLVLQQRTGLLYVGHRSGEIAIVDPQVSLPIDSFKVAGGVVALALDREEQSLFVLSAQPDQVLKLDLVSKRQLGRFAVEAGAGALAVMGGEP